jgi:PAS domain S-box-containing protein
VKTQALNYDNLLTLALWDASVDAMRITDSKGIVVKVNKSYCSLTGFKEDELVGKQFILAYISEERENLLKHYNDFITNGQSSIRTEKKVTFLNGSKHHLEVSYSLLNLSGNNYILAVFRDITEFIETIEREISKQKNIELQLNQSKIDLSNSEENYRNLVQSSHDIIIMLDSQGNFKFINRIAEELTGFKISDWIGKSFAALVHPEDLQTANKAFIDSLNGKQSSYGIRIFNSNGETLFVDISTVPVFDNGKVTNVVSICRDITKQKHAENELIAIEKQQSLIFKSLPVVVYTAAVNPEIDTYWVSESVLEVTGYTQEEYQSEQNFWSRRLHPEDAPKTIDAFNNIAALKEITIEYRWKVKSGEYKWFLDKAIADKNNVDYYGVTFDINRRKETELALIDSEERFHSMVKNIDQLVIEFDENGNYLNVFTEDINLIAQKGLNWKNKNVADVLGNDLAAPFIERIQRVIKTRTPELYEYQLEVIGGLRWFSGRLNPIRTSEDKIKSVSFIARDITNRKLAEEEVIAKKNELEKLNAEKDKFFSIIAHDLRSPFNGFLGFTEIMKNELNTLSLAEINKMSNHLNKSAHNLFSLLNNLLEWSVMQRGLTDFLPESYSLNSIIENCINSESHLLKQKEISLTTDIQNNLTVFVDRKMTEFVFRNLITNAVKFTDRKGRINISASKESNNLIQVCVMDNGIGMNKEIISGLFILNTNVKRSGTEHEPSTGLGLILCKEFISKNGGTIWVESTEGEGSKFCFTLKNLPE